MSTASPTSSRSARTALLAAGSLAWRELRRFFRQRSRVIGALVQPILFWILFGAGLGGSFRMPGGPASAGYANYFLPGVAVMILLFTAIFSTISIIEDRREGFLQAVLVSPIPRFSLVLGKVLGGSILAVIQALVFVGIAPVLASLGAVSPVSLDLPWMTWAAAVAWMAVLAFLLTSLGYLIAWPMESTQGFHAVMSVFLMPMWLLSGAFFPVPEQGWLAWIMRANPLTYGLAGLRRLMSTGDPVALGPLPAWSTCVAVTVSIAAAIFLADVVLTRHKHVA
ncbi:Daunorubicin/doxorubicin resistance ABC transporter permease protein DrrB [Caulifigura coniformis]|uniref:Transport permease protein n=1 Tax=Caulifigura coniformis TaxID=2527983 RepID=A0A517SKY2_9PLAN|nr:ABC transporter permease [Caulifigura coniformis]QDT56778.1 Daunorubicin/doxorubicin resistance ABC transporter permease protein DrrB [Caulifigura coniformis]